MENSNNDINNPSSSLSSFLCNEDTSCLSEANDKWTDHSNYLPSFQFDHTYNYNSHYDYNHYDNEDDYIELMIRKETDSGFGSLSWSPSWLHRARSDSLNWILHAKTQLGFCNQTAYLCIMYFDRFLSMRCLNEDRLWAIRLLSIACLTLAAKMEESKVPGFSEYPLEGGFGFDSRMTQKMELLILSTLDWKMCLVTPFVYLHFLVTKLGNKEGTLDGLTSRAIDLIVTSMKEINTIENRPSMVAAAAVLAATDWQLTQDDLSHKISTLTLWQTSQNEELYRCYSLMKRLAANNDANTPISTQVISQELRATTSVTKTKRRLNFSDGDQNTSSLDKIQRR